MYAEDAVLICSWSLFQIFGALFQKAASPHRYWGVADEHISLVLGFLANFSENTLFFVLRGASREISQLLYKVTFLFFIESSHFLNVTVHSAVLNSMISGCSRISSSLSSVRFDANKSRLVIQGLRYEIAPRRQGVYRWENRAKEPCQHLYHGLALHRKHGSLLGAHSEHPPPYVGAASDNRCRSTAEHMHNNDCINDV